MSRVNNIDAALLDFKSASEFSRLREGSSVFVSEEAVWDAWCAYVRWADANPLEKKEQGKGLASGEEFVLTVPRPLSLEGFATFLRVSGLVEITGSKTKQLRWLTDVGEMNSRYKNAAAAIRQMINAERIEQGLINNHNSAMTMRLLAIDTEDDAKNTTQVPIIYLGNAPASPVPTSVSQQWNEDAPDEDDETYDETYDEDFETEDDFLA